MLNNLYRQFLQKLTDGKVSTRRRLRRASFRAAGIAEHLEPRCLLSGTAIAGLNVLQGHTGTSNPSVAHGEVSQTPPVLTAQQLATQQEQLSQSHSGDPTFQGQGPQPSGGISTTAAPAATQTNAPNGAAAANDLQFFRISSDQPAGGQYSTVGEPSVGSSQNAIPFIFSQLTSFR